MNRYSCWGNIQMYVSAESENEAIEVFKEYFRNSQDVTSVEEVGANYAYTLTEEEGPAMKRVGLYYDENEFICCKECGTSILLGEKICPCCGNELDWGDFE